MGLSVEVISDVICPWCYIGKRRLEKAKTLWTTPCEIEVRWSPFQLNPGMPRGGIDRKEYRTRKFGSWEKSLELDVQVMRAAEAEGLTFSLERIERTPNTHDGHRLIWLAGILGIQDRVVETLFRAYFTEARDISNRAGLVEIAEEAGIERRHAEELLDGDDGIAEIRESEERARRLGVSGVPHFIVNERIAMSGAHPPEDFLSAFNQASRTGEP